MNSIRFLCLAALAAFGPFVHANAMAGEGQIKPKKVLCTTFPIYQLTRNITEGSNTVTVDLMLPAAMGCPHDYTLTTQDMTKIAAADILVINGLGMEEFMGKPVQRANPDIIVVDSSQGVPDLIEFDEDEHHREEGESLAHENEKEEAEHEDHHHSGINNHIFTSPALSAALVENIAGRLCILDPAGAAIYAANSARYTQKLRELAEEMQDAGKGFSNNRIVEPHGAFDYFARDVGLNIVAHLQPHGQEPSAAQMLELLETIREEKPAAIVVEPQYPAKVGYTLGEETGVAVLHLDPVANGPDDARLDYYETVMRKNLSTLRNALGGN